MFTKYVLLASALTASLRAQTDLGRIIPADKTIHVAALGDYGSGSRHQIDVAHAMQRRNQQEKFDLGITMGDNFYVCGARSVHDPKWTARWEDLYTPLGIQFYAALGNHDYGHPQAMCPLNQASPKAEVERTELSESWRMPARYYTFAAGPVRFIAIDTEGWSEKQLEWIEETLEKSAKEPGIRWRIVYGHHPIYTSGYHINQRRIGALERQLLPVLEENKVDLYIAGHDHDMERLGSDRIAFLICGAGGAELRASHKPIPNSKFTAGVYGFLDLSIGEHHLGAQFYDTNLDALDPMPLELTR